jgi:hypothetical protein
MDNILYSTEARALEMAHFTSEADSPEFEAEFRSYLVPGLLARQTSSSSRSS